MDVTASALPLNLSEERRRGHAGQTEALAGEMGLIRVACPSSHMRQPVGGWANASRDSELGFGKEALEPDHPLHRLRRHPGCRQESPPELALRDRQGRPYLANPVKRAAASYA